MTRIFKTSWFTRFAKKNGITQQTLLQTVAELEAGLFDADLGGGVFKKRIARSGEGKSGGFRSFVCFLHGERAFFVYGFRKSARQNINQAELAELKKLAGILFALDDKNLELAINSGKLVETGRKNAKNI